MGCIMKIAIMQPYFAPYLGYFQMINYVDKFIFYDDVNYIKNGWINRNQIDLNGINHNITIPIKNQTNFKYIKDTEIDWDDNKIKKLISTLKQKYTKKNIELLDDILFVFDKKIKYISEFNIELIYLFCDYLQIKTILKKSSEIEYQKIDRLQKLISICEIERCDEYINSIGGYHLYDSNDFLKKNIKLSFIEGKNTLSIIDVCMNNEKLDIINQLNNFKLI